ncbi:MAG: hypothetical protein AMS15_08260 [Planctomycetes bacterium DG_23]|nr:MAG: hypothetical protein AMS15_08260 [Planctomycetes bacterium DG_23]
MGAFSYLSNFSKKPPWKGYFAQRVVRPWELPSIMRKHIYTGVMGNIYYSLVTGIFFIYYGNAVGLSRFQWGLMGGLGSLLLTAQILSALLTQRLGQRKFLWFASALAARGVRLLGILVSLLFWNAGYPYAPLTLILAISLAHLFEAIATPPWMSWLADIIPERQHGGFWGRRSAWIAFAVICVVVPTGLILDRTPEEWKILTAVIIFFGASIVGFIDLLIHGTLPEPAMAIPKRTTRFLTQILAPIFDLRFRPWLIFNLCWTFSMTLGGALATLYFLEELDIKNNLLGGSIVLTSFWLLGGVLTGAWTGRLVDRVGPKRVLFWGHLFWGFLPAFWLFASPRTALIWLSCSSITSGIACTAAWTAANKLVTRLPAPPDRAMYVAVSSCIGSLAGAIGITTAGIVLRQLEGWTWTVGGWTLVPFHLLFITSLTLRLLTTNLLIRRIKDPRRQEK